MKWIPLKDGNISVRRPEGWVLQLTHNGSRTLGVWTNGRAVWTVIAGQA